MICPNCGNNLNEGTKFCENCGTNLENIQTNQQPMNDQPMNPQPMYNQPMSQQPMNQQPMYNQPMNDQPMNQQPMNQQPYTKTKKGNAGLIIIIIVLILIILGVGAYFLFIKPKDNNNSKENNNQENNSSDKYFMECATSGYNMSFKQTYDMKFNFDNDGKIKNIDMIMTMEPDEEILEFIDEEDYKETAKIDYCKTIDNENVKDCSYEFDEKNLKVTIKYTSNEEAINGLSEEELEKTSYEELKKLYSEDEIKEVMNCYFNPTDKIVPKENERSSSDWANETMAEGAAYDVLESATSYVAEYMLSHQGDWNTSVAFTCDGTKCSAKVDGKEEKLDIKGAIPQSGSIVIDEKQEASIKEELKFKNYKCTSGDYGKVNCKHK